MVAVEVGVVAAGRDEIGGLVGQGGWLAERRGVMDRGESGWLKALAAFDRSGGWGVDGQTSCVTWLMWRCKLGRRTAFEKLRVAHELERRPVLAEAFEVGKVSYSAVRAISRLEGVSEEVDAALVAVAEGARVEDLERVLRYYQCLEGQEYWSDRLARRYASRGLRVARGYGGLGRVELVLSEEEIAEVEAALAAFLSAVGECSAGHAPDPTSSADDNHAAECGGAVDECPAGHAAAGPPAAGRASVGRAAAGDGLVEEGSAGVGERVPWWERRADAFMDLVRTGLAHVGDGQLAGADRYMVHVVRHVRPDRCGDPAGQPSDVGAVGPAQLVGGGLIDEASLSRLACDASRVDHLVDDESGETLNLGRKTRVWSTAQRRAVLVRDGGRCRFPGCDRTRGDVHHIQWWTRQGPTDIANGLFVCGRHHDLLHRGFGATGSGHGTVTFTRPDGSIVGTTNPPASIRQLPLSAA